MLFLSAEKRAGEYPAKNPKGDFMISSAAE
jgi:hypothetical protein